MSEVWNIIRHTSLRIAQLHTFVAASRSERRNLPARYWRRPYEAPLQCEAIPRMVYYYFLNSSQPAQISLSVAKRLAHALALLLSPLVRLRQAATQLRNIRATIVMPLLLLAPPVTAAEPL